MPERISDNSRIAKNTLLLYLRMLLTLMVSLYASRIILQTLGVSDYGLYNVVGGIVTMFTFLSATLSSGTQRFLSFALGEGDIEKMKSVFSTVSYLHVFIAVIVFVVSEVVGFWLLYHQMQIPEDRMNAAVWVFQFSIITTMVAIIQVPYMSSLIAHEKMDIYAWVSVYDAVMKLLIVYLIQIIDTDKLILYAFLYFLVHVSTTLIYMFYCRWKYTECRMFRGLNKDIFREIASFSGWNVFGCAGAVLQGPGVNILLNMFFGTVVNAARGIAFQANGLILQFVSSFQTAVNPQIVKLYASGQIDKMIHLVINSSKMTAFLILLIAVPLFVEVEFVLNIWLGQYPDYTPIFLRIIIIQAFIQAITRPVVMALHAVGKMKTLNLTVGLVLLLSLPISYILLFIGLSPVSIFWVNVLPWVVELFIELLLLNKYIDFPFWGFYKKVYGTVFPLAVLMLIIPFVIKNYLDYGGWTGFMLVCFVSTLFSCFVIYYLGLPPSLRSKIVEVICMKVKRFK
jgi:hypothetical protein